MYVKGQKGLVLLCMLGACDGMLVRATANSSDAVPRIDSVPQTQTDPQTDPAKKDQDEGVVPKGTEPASPDAASEASSSDNKDVKPAAFSFFAVGDTRSNQDIAQQNFQSMASLAPDAIALFNSGDLTADGKPSQWQTHVQAVNLGSAGKIRMDLTDWDSSHIRYFGIVGNHDTHESDWRDSWNNFLPGQQNLGNNDDKGIWFTVRYSNALFIVLDSENKHDTQTTWLKGVLADAAADPTIEWKFAFYHHPVYPCNYKSPYSSGVEWVRAFEKYGVDMVFNGHAHVYERTCPMINGQCQSGGVVYIISGGGGAGTKDVDLSQKMSVGPDTYDCSKVVLAGKGNWHHYCQIAVDGKQLTYACYSHDATTNPDDTLTIVK